ncbi:hypothetical protein HS088_TW12G00014 [Tripterygium wilfordii]|uniref:Cytochrome P450 n=1 Tax=Tripterygium wilfordii TaxID=458696 RepID=A0A7J7CXJ4_TRIWF|nr:cytochrome P450 81Q32-like [Tripterygium wilfordii]KAF5738821.1 hypothetical protein HS088_TW12G00014 [Tripterygium wilfordii]
MDTLYYLGLSLSVLFLLYKLVFRNKEGKEYKNLPPSPPGALPIVGHFLTLKKPVHEGLFNLCTKYGPILYLRLGPRPALVVGSHEAIEECLTKHDLNFATRPIFLSKKLVTYDFTTLGYTPYGHHWRNLRRLTTLEILSNTRLQMTSYIRVEEVRMLTKNLYQSFFLKAGVAKANMKSFFYMFTFNIVIKMLSGERYFGEDDMGSAKGKGRLEDLMEIFRSSEGVNLSDFFPILRWLPFYRVEKKMMKDHKKRDAFLQGFVEDQRKMRAANPNRVTVKDKRPIIDVLLSLQETDPEFCTDEIIKGIILVMLTAGTDTTAQAATYAAKDLVSHPECLKKAREEIDSVVGSSRLIEDADLNKLPYLNCVVNESLRLGPAAPMPLPHLNMDDCTVGGYDVPKGTMLFVNIWALHRDPKLWEDPYAFKPERFLGFEAGGDQKAGLKFIPFGAGRRQCPGITMGTRVMAIALGTLIQSFDWEKPQGEYENEVIFRPRRALTAALSQL